MDLKFTDYRSDHFDSCIKLIKETWNFHDKFKGLSDDNLVYEYYLRSCLNWNAHLQVIINSDKHVKGLLFASIEDDSLFNEMRFKMEDLRLERWLKKKVNQGCFGETGVARRVFDHMKTNDAKGEKYSHLFDSEINLFIVSKDLRGQGLGIKLMDKYMDFCKRHHLKRSFLWSDTGCSYTFYEKYGFKLHARFSENDDKEQNGMIFYIDVLREDNNEDL